MRTWNLLQQVSTPCQIGQCHLLYTLYLSGTRVTLARTRRRPVVLER
jgi:hypothetical protein